MKKLNNSVIATLCVALFFFVIGCNTPAPKPTETTVQVETKTDITKIKAEIQALESSWSAADNARDANAVAAFYADDAMSMSNDKTTLVGKAAILADITEGLAKKAAGSTVSYEVMEVFGDEKVVTEVGKSISKDASGNVLSTGKYMGVWDKRDGKFVCIRDIYNNDKKEE